MRVMIESMHHVNADGKSDTIGADKDVFLQADHGRTRSVEKSGFEVRTRSHEVTAAVPA